MTSLPASNMDISLPRLLCLNETATNTTIEYVIVTSFHYTSVVDLLSIIFIHGLGCESPATWTKDRMFWPRDLVLQEIPKARVFDFQYNIKNVIKKGDDSWSWVHEPAEALHKSLGQQRGNNV